MTRQPRIAIPLLAGLIAAGAIACQPPAPKAASEVIKTPLSDQPTPELPAIEQIPLPPIEMPVKPPDQMPIDPPQTPQDADPPEESIPPESTPPEDSPIEEPPALEETPAVTTPDPMPEVEPAPVAEVAPEPTPVPERPALTAADIRDDYLRRFNAQVERHKQYPKQARRMGRQGRVVMLIQLDSDGQLINLQIVQSSGHLALDTAATQAVKDAAPFPPPPQPAFDAAPTFQMGLSFELR